MKSIYKDERGIGHFLLAFLIIAVIAAVGIVGYRVIHKEKTPQEKALSAKQASDQANCMKVYHDKTLCKFAVNYSDLANLAYTAVDNSVDTQGQTSQITIKSDGKGNTSVSSKAGNQTYDAITIGNTLYVNANNTGWIKYTSNEDDAPNATNPANNLKTNFSDDKTPKDKQVSYKKLGKEKCGNETCSKYQVIDPDMSGTNYIWISTKTNRLMHWYNKSSDGTNDMVVTYGSVTITAPANATDAAAAAAAEMQAAQAAAAQYAQ